MRARLLHALAALLSVAAVAAACERPRDPVVAAATATGSLVPPLHDAVAGEEIVLARGPDEWRYTVAEARDTDVVVHVVHYRDGVPQAEPLALTWHRNGFGVPETAVIRRIDRGRIELDGERLRCWVLQTDSRQGSFAYWISEDVPVHGLLKMTRLEDGAPVEAQALVRVR